MSGLSNPLKWFIEFVNGTEETSTPVTMRSSLGYPPIMYAHNKLCGDFARLPLDVKKRVGDGAENDLRHDGYRLFREEPNKIQSPSTFKEQWLSHAIMYGNGRVAVIRNSAGGIDELIPMMPDRTWTGIWRGEKWHVTRPLHEQDENLFDGFRKDDEGTLVFNDRDVLHITGFSFNGVTGLGLLDIAKVPFSIGLDAQKHTSKQLAKGFAGKLFLKVPEGRLRKESEAQEFIDAFNKREAGADNAGKAGLLREGVSIESIGQTNSDAQKIELMKFSRQDIALLFGIDSMPFDGESVSYNSLEQKNLSYLVTLDRWLAKVEEECDRKLRTPAQKVRGSHYFKFNTAAILRTDLNTTMTALCNAITHKIMSPNEARSKLDMNPYEGGDEYSNPAITPGSGDSSSHESSKKDPQEDSGTQNRLALQSMLSSLLQTEANNAVSGCKKANFLDWIDKNYAKWEPKLADKLESVGLDRDLARIHCEESKAILLDVAGQSTAETLEENVKTAVSEWKNRCFSIMEGGVNA